MSNDAGSAVPPPGVSSPSSGRGGKRRRRGPPFELWVGGPVFLLALAAAAAAAFRVPVRTTARTPQQVLEERLRKGPDSYFHCIFDPEKLLGLTGQVDLTLESFQRETSHGVLIAALPHLPPDAPDLAMHAAELWQPGVAGGDNGVIVFIFPADRRVQVLIGYGLESVLPDAEVYRLVGSTFVPAARNGDLSAGVEALLPPLLEKLRTVPRVEPKTRRNWHLETIAVAAKEIPRRARFLKEVWLANQAEVRLVISAVLAFGLAVAAAFLAHIGQCGALLVRVIHAHATGTRVLGAAAEVVSSLLRPLQLAAILFAMVVGTSFFFPGSGSFGGAGIDLVW